MFGTHDLLLFLFAGILLNITPGADTAFVISQSIRRGTRGGIAATLGISAGCMVHTAAGALGLSALLQASALAFTIIKWVGVCYLCVLGLQLLFSRASEAAAASDTTDIKMRSIFVQGFLTNALNPKVALFFLAFLPQFISPDAPYKGFAFAMLGLIFICTGTTWLFVVAWAASRTTGKLRASATARRWLERFVGAVLLGLGARLALMTRA
jgi:threonine/homoserine/homoserine lactone efflux protein